MPVLRLAAACAALAAAPFMVRAATFQFELLGASGEWLAIRENIPATAADTAACRYPGIDPSEFVGVKVHFVRISAEMKRGILTPLAASADSSVWYEAGRSGEGCTTPPEAEKHWHEIAAYAKRLGMDLSPKPPAAVVLGATVPAKACVVTAAAPGAPCRQIFRPSAHGRAIQVVVSLSAVSQAPDERTCQFVGHRFGVALEITGGNAAAGGFADHYDCRAQQFDPLRLYELEGAVVVIGAFRGANIADRDEYPFVVILPQRGA